jgi:type VII secretion protein EccB
MWNRRDQLQAYQFLRRRVVSALVFRSANHPESPSKRWIMATLCGLLLALLIMGGFGIYGLFTGGAASSWTAGKRVIVEKETGAIFVLDADQRLRPVLNFASAALFLGQDRPKIDQVSQSSLRLRPRGTAIGIPGAPDSLPMRGALVKGPWTACSRTAVDRGGTPRPEVSLIIGDQPTGTWLKSNLGLLVSESTSSTSYLVQDGRAYPMASPEVSRVLGYSDVPIIPVGTGWLNTLPRGGELDFIDIPGAGTPGIELDGRPSVVGEVISVRREGVATEYFVVADDGLIPVNQTEALLILAAAGRGAVPGAGEAVDVPPGAIAAARQPASSLGLDLPARLATAERVESNSISVCSTVVGSADVRVSLSRDAPVGKNDSSIQVGGNDFGGPLADVVSMRPGHGALVREMVAGGAGSGTAYLVTDEGRRYPLEAEASASFGYSSSDVTRVPKAFVSLLPNGPALSAESAATPVDPAEVAAIPIGR